MTDLSKYETLDSPVLKSIADVRYRHVEHGPGYLCRGPAVDVGILRLRPGDSTVNHYHEHLEESFLVLEGVVSMWIDGRKRAEFGPGDYYRSPPGEMHYFRNEDSGIWRACFVKAPFDPQDTHPVPWHPGAPVPRPAVGRAV